MRTKIKRGQLYDLYEGLSRVRQVGAKFCYVIAKNKNKLESEIKAQEKAKEPSDEYKQFLVLAEEVRKAHAKKDRRGNPVMIPKMGPDGQQRFFYDIPDAENEEGPFLKEISALEKKHLKLIKEQEAKEKEYAEKFLLEDTDIELHKIRLEEIPEGISQEEMDGIYPIIFKDEEEESK